MATMEGEGRERESVRVLGVEEEVERLESGAFPRLSLSPLCLAFPRTSGHVWGDELRGLLGVGEALCENGERP